MGSSKKHKEKRDKKKHKKDRSRSRSHERESHRRSSHKSKKDQERRKTETYDHDSEAKASETKKVFSGVEAAAQEQHYEGRSSQKVAPTTASQASEDEFDIEELLDSKLSTEKKSSKKTSNEKSRSTEHRKRKRQEDDYDGESSVSSKRENSRGDNDVADKITSIKREIKEERQEIAGSSGTDQKAEKTDSENGVGDKVHLSLSISEANKLRAKLGLKPLVVSEDIPGLGNDKEGSSSTSTKTEVFVKTTNMAEVKKAEKMREKLQVSKEKRRIAEKFSTVKPLAHSDSEDESAASWVKKSRKLQDEKEQAEKRAKLLEEMDAEFGVSALVDEEFEKTKKSYSSKDLKGLKVAHDSSMLKEGQQIILTLKDKGVLDEDDDVLQNVNLVDEEHYAKNVENKKRKKDYQPYEEEYDEFGILKKKNMLSKYDEEIHGKEKKTFTLGSNTQPDKEIELIRMKLKQQQGVTLEMPNMALAREYYTPGEMVQFKRPKKKKRKLRRTAMLKADDLLDNAELDGFAPDQSEGHATGSEAKTHSWEPAFQTQGDAMGQDPDDDVQMEEDLSKVVVDEDQAEKELHSALHKARKLKQRKSLFAPEKLAVEMLKNSEVADDEVGDSKTGPIVLNSTAEFCRTLGDIPTYGLSGNRDEEAEELMDFEQDMLEERQRNELDALNRGAWNEVNMDETPGEIMMRENEPILEEEPDITVGVSAALQVAQKKGYLDKESKKSLMGLRSSQLQAKSYTIEEKFYEDDKFGKRDRYTGPIQDFREKGSYKPDVKLEYIDDSGRLLNAKEAFRYLSHKFHGKGPGKNKVDKRMKKLDQDTKLKQMSSTDTPLNTVKLLQAKQKETQSPFIVLSGGSKALTQTMISKPKPT